MRDLPAMTTQGTRAAHTGPGEGDPETLGMTHSACPECRRVVPARVVTDGTDVFLRRFCPQHGEAESLVWRGVEEYLAVHRHSRPAWRPREFHGDASQPCPQGCGFCDRHEQHLCLPIVEVTSRCDLACPICLVDAGGGWVMSAEEFGAVLDALARCEAQIDVLNLSGGEPLLHPELLQLLDVALARPEIVRVSLSTNGLRLLEDPQLLRELASRRIVVALQFDGFRDPIYETLRGRPLLKEKLLTLDALAEADLTTSLTMTVAGGVNDDQFAGMLELLFASPNIVSFMIQPIAFTGRASRLRGQLGRLTIPDVLRGLAAAQHPAVSAQDFLPLPCCYPTCFSLAFYLTLEGGGAVSLSSLASPEVVAQAVANRVFYGLDPDEHRRLKEMVYDVWSAPAAAVPDSERVLAALRGLVREVFPAGAGFDPRRTFVAAERRVKSVFVHAFQDADTFDLARVRRCCNAYPQADGRLIPCCVRNVLGAPPGAKDGA
jgi:hypothetical protein